MKMKGKKATRKMNAKLAPDQWDRRAPGTGQGAGQGAGQAAGQSAGRSGGPPGLRLDLKTSAPAKRITPRSTESGESAP